MAGDLETERPETSPRVVDQSSSEETDEDVSTQVPTVEQSSVLLSTVDAVAIALFGGFLSGAAVAYGIATGWQLLAIGGFGAVVLSFLAAYVRIAGLPDFSRLVPAALHDRWRRWRED